MRLRIGRACEAEADHFLFHLDTPQHRERRFRRARPHRRRRRLRSRSSRRECRRAVARDQRVAHADFSCFASVFVVSRGAQRLVHEAEVEILRHRSREDVGILRRVRDAAAGNRLVHFGKVGTRHGEPSAGGKHEARQQMRHVVLAAVPAAEQCDVRAGLDVERHAVDAIGAAVLGVHERRGGDLSLEPRHLGGRVDHQLRIDEPRRLELGDDLLVLDPDVLLRRIPGQQLPSTATGCPCTPPARPRARASGSG